MLEFISREYMSGSTGKVAPPIISRLYQFTSDGMSAYNQGKEIRFSEDRTSVSTEIPTQLNSYYVLLPHVPVARKIAYTPFPLPHSQLTTLFVLVIIVFMPILMLTYLTNEVFGFILNGLTVMCFSGLHEVARELEAPFQNVPNDVPLNNFQAQFNEAIMVSMNHFLSELWSRVALNRIISPKLNQHLLMITSLVPPIDNLLRVSSRSLLARRNRPQK